MKLTAESTVINDNKLNTNIDNAQATADGAQTSADNAQTSADNAQGTANTAVTKADNAQSTADTAVSKADTAQATANQAKTIADNTNQYFWFTSSGSDTGAHISEKTQSEFIASPSGGNLLARSNGIAVRDGLEELAVFGASAAKIGKDSDKNLQLGTDGFKFYNGSTLLATLNADTSNTRSGFSIKKGKSHIGIYGTDADPVIQIALPPITADEYPRMLILSPSGLDVSFLGFKVEASSSGLGLGNVYFNGNQIDYVWEQGTSRIWTYRKWWKSGIAECWGTYTASIAITTSAAAYGGYRSGALNIPTFPLTFTSAPTVTATAQSATGFWVNNVAPTTTGGTFYLSAGASLAAANRSIAFHVIGKYI